MVMTGDTATIGNFAPLLDASGSEVFEDICRLPGCRIERIVSAGQTTPIDHPYQQEHDEWVLVLSGRAIVEASGCATELCPGDHLLIPAGMRHRVIFTASDQPTIWLAVHVGEPAN